MQDLKIPEYLGSDGIILNMGNTFYPSSGSSVSDKIIELEDYIKNSLYFEIRRFELPLLDNLGRSVETLNKMLEASIEDRNLAIDIIKSNTKYLGRLLEYKYNNNSYGFTSVLREYTSDQLGKL